MQKLKCELCGSIDFSRTDDGFFQCDACGCKYTLEQAKTIIGGTVETTIGEAEYNRLMENARTQAELKHPEFKKTIDNIIREFPGEPEPYILYLQEWFGRIIMSSLYNEPMNGLYYDSLYRILENSNKIAKEEVEENFTQYYLKIQTDLINSNLSVVNFCILGLNRIPYQHFEEAFKIIYDKLIAGEIKREDVFPTAEIDFQKQITCPLEYPPIKELFEEGKQIAQELTNNNVVLRRLSNLPNVDLTKLKDVVDGKGIGCFAFCYFDKDWLNVSEIIKKRGNDSQFADIKMVILGKAYGYYNPWDSIDEVAIRIPNIADNTHYTTNELMEIAKDNTKKLVFRDNICIKCGQKLEVPLFSPKKLKCNNCKIHYNYSDF